MTDRKEKFGFRKHPHVVMGLFVGFLVAAILSFTEWQLRKNGNHPGVTGDPGTLEIVDSIFVYPDFITDEYGITKINPEIIDTVNKFVLFPGTDSELFDNKEFNTVRYLGELTIDYKHFNEGIAKDSEFGIFIRKLKEKQEGDLSETDSAYIKYSVSPVNRDGFRSIEFKNYQTKNKKVLLLGDSFTWGMSAQPIVQSFSDILSARGYVTFNTGIAAVDPVQYLSIAKVYIPRLKPDVVVVNFYMGNDEMDYYRDAEPYRPVYHYTNAGLLSAYPNGVYLEPRQAYQAVLEKIFIPHQEKIFNRMMSKTVLTTRLWLLVHNIHHKFFAEEIVSSRDEPRYEGTVTEWYIEEIKKICDAHGSKMLLMLIPCNDKKPWQPSMYDNFKMQAERNFKKTSYHYLHDLEAGDFGVNDDHFSNRGMKKYADLLQSLVDSVLSGRE